MKINNINSDFVFSDITLQDPKGVQGGLSYTTKVLFNKEPLFIQTKKCKTKNGFVTTGKKTYIDLMFSREDEYMLEWIEKLETQLQELIFENSSDWFENELSKDDIEDSFLPSLKPYKSGKYYLLRCFTTYNINNISSNNLKIYDEENNDLTVSDIKEDDTVITILQVNDIKFTSKNFQIDFLVKQVMQINEVNIISDKLIIKNDEKKEEVVKNTHVIPQTHETTSENVEQTINDRSSNTTNNSNEQVEDDNSSETVTTVLESSDIQLDKLDDLKETEIVNNLENKEVIIDNTDINVNDIDLNDINNDNDNDNDNNDTDMNNEIIKEEPKTLDNKEDLRENNHLGDNCLEEKNDLIEEVNLDEFLVDVGEKCNNDDEIKLKKSTDVYMEIYKTAKDKAKVAKQNAINAFLEMNNIKQKYNLTDILESDDEEEINF